MLVLKRVNARINEGGVKSGYPNDEFRKMEQIFLIKAITNDLQSKSVGICNASGNDLLGLKQRNLIEKEDYGF